MRKRFPGKRNIFIDDELHAFLTRDRISSFLLALVYHKISLLVGEDGKLVKYRYT